MIRFATQKDIPQMVKILEEHQLLIPTLDYDTWNVPTLVAERDGEIQGLARFFPGQPYAIADVIAVKRRLMNKGVGVMLFEAMRGILNEQGIEAVLGFCFADRKYMFQYAQRYRAADLGNGTAFVMRT